MKAEIKLQNPEITKEANNNQRRPNTSRVAINNKSAGNLQRHFYRHEKLSFEEKQKKLINTKSLLSCRCNTEHDVQIPFFVSQVNNISAAKNCSVNYA